MAVQLITIYCLFFRLFLFTVGCHFQPFHLQGSLALLSSYFFWFSSWPCCHHFCLPLFFFLRFIPGIRAPPLFIPKYFGIRTTPPYHSISVTVFMLSAKISFLCKISAPLTTSQSCYSREIVAPWIPLATETSLPRSDHMDAWNGKSQTSSWSPTPASGVGNLHRGHRRRRRLHPGKKGLTHHLSGAYGWLICNVQFH